MLRVLLFFGVLSFGATGGCYTVSAVNFSNGTTGTIKLKSCHTGKEIEIVPGASQVLPHAVGDLIVTTRAGGQLRFVAVEPPAMDLIDSKYLDKHSSVLGPGQVTLSVSLERDGKLYAVLP